MSWGHRGFAEEAASRGGKVAGGRQEALPHEIEPKSQGGDASQAWVGLMRVGRRNKAGCRAYWLRRCGP